MAVALLLASAVTAHGQYTRTPPRTVIGKVEDHGKEPLRGAVVEIEAEDTLTIQSYVTTEKGEYHFHNLRSDVDYRIWATFRGHRSKTHEIGKFDHHPDREVDIMIDLDK